MIANSGNSCGENTQGACLKDVTVRPRLRAVLLRLCVVKGLLFYFQSVAGLSVVLLCMTGLQHPFIQLTTKISNNWIGLGSV